MRTILLVLLLALLSGCTTDESDAEYYHSSGGIGGPYADPKDNWSGSESRGQREIPF